MTDKCENCRFYKDDGKIVFEELFSKGKQVEIESSICRQNSNFNRVSKDMWCGKHKPIVESKEFDKDKLVEFIKKEIDLSSEECSEYYLTRTSVLKEVLKFIQGEDK